MFGNRQNELPYLVRRSVPVPFTKESASNTTRHFLHITPIQEKDLQQSNLLPENITDGGTTLVNGSKSVIYIGGLFDLSDGEWSLSGRSELAAAELAIEHVNAKNIVPGHLLELVNNDTQVSQSRWTSYLGIAGN